MIFQHITLFLVSQATSKVIRKCLINLWSTWHKCIIDTTSIHCFLIYLIHVLDIKCCHTGYVKAMLSKNIFISQGPFCTSHLKFCTPLANFRPVGSFARFAIFVIIDPLFRTSLATSSRKFAKTYGTLFARLVTNEGATYCILGELSSNSSFLPCSPFRQIPHFPRRLFWHPT